MEKSEKKGDKMGESGEQIEDKDMKDKKSEETGKRDSDNLQTSGSSRTRRKKRKSEKKEPVSKKPSKKKKDKEEASLVELIHKKNEMLENMRQKLENTEELLKLKEDRLIRVIAEFENYKKRTYREQDLHKKRMHSNILVELLPVLDDFDRAMETEHGADSNFYKGIKLIHSRLKDILSRMGLEEIKAEGEVFDPRLHEAMGEVENDEVEPGRVAHVVLKGYKLDDIVVRPARVMVAAFKENNENINEG